MYNAWGIRIQYPPRVVQVCLAAPEPSLPASVEGSMSSNHQPTGNHPQATVNQPWIRLVDFCREHGVGENRARRVVARLAPELAQKRPREQGGKSEWWVSPDALTALRGNQPQSTGAVNGAAESSAAKQSQPTDSAGWLTALEDLRSELDRVHSELREEQVSRREVGERAAAAEARAVSAEGNLAEAAGAIERLRSEIRALEEKAEARERQVEEAERARAAYAELLAEERAAWWQWVSYLKGLSLLRRLRRLPDPPEELARGRKRLAAPETKEG